MYGIKTAKDGTLQATLGKTLKKSVKFKAVDLKSKPVLLGGNFKEITFAIVPSNISMYIYSLQEDNRLTIDGKCSIEASFINAYIQVDNSVNDEEIFELWLWN